MFSEIAFVFCAILAIQASFGFCLPSGKPENIELETKNKKQEPEIKDDEEEEDYYVVLQSPTQSLKVEVIEEGHRSEEEILSDERAENVADKGGNPNGKIKEEDDDEEEATKCNWRRLYKLYVKKKKATEGKNFYFARERRKEIRNAFRVICDNPEEVILQLLEKNEEQ